MEDVMYGVMFNASMDIWVKDPPVNASKKLNASEDWLANQFWISEVSTPGIGILEPIRITRIIQTTYNSFRRMSFNLTTF